MEDFKLTTEQILDSTTEKRGKKSDESGTFTVPAAQISAFSGGSNSTRSKNGKGKKGKGKYAKNGKGGKNVYTGGAMKTPVGETNVQLRWHSPDEYKLLTPEQKAEYDKFTNKKKVTSLQKENNKLKAKVASLSNPSPATSTPSNLSAEQLNALTSLAPLIASLHPLLDKSKSTGTISSVQPAGEKSDGDEADGTVESNDDDSHESMLESEEEFDDEGSYDSAAAARAMQKLIPALLH